MKFNDKALCIHDVVLDLKNTSISLQINLSEIESIAFTTGDRDLINKAKALGTAKLLIDSTVAVFESYIKLLKHDRKQSNLLNKV